MSTTHSRPRFAVLNQHQRKQVATELGYYVYMLVDPADGIPFYVGKGQGQRFASHGWEALLDSDDTEHESNEDVRRAKTYKIQQMQRRGDEPQIWILRYGLNKTSYTEVEATCIDLLLTMPILPLAPQYDSEPSHRFPLALKNQQLTNRRREESIRGIILLDDFVAACVAPDLDLAGLDPEVVGHEVCVFTTNGWREHKEILGPGRSRTGNGYKREWLVSSVRKEAVVEIATATVGWWRASSERLSKIRFAVVAGGGLTRLLLKLAPDKDKAAQDAQLLKKSGDIWEAHGILRQRYTDSEGKHSYRVMPYYHIVQPDGTLLEPDGRPVVGEQDIETLRRVYDALIGPHGHRIERKRGAQGSIKYLPVPANGSGTP